eukprot:UN07335
MQPHRVMTIYHFILTIGHLVAALFYTGISIYAMIETKASLLSVGCLIYSILMLIGGCILMFGVNIRGEARAKVIPGILLVFALGWICTQTVFFAFEMHDWQRFLSGLMDREYPQTLITRWVSENEIPAKVLTFVGVPFYVIWLGSLYIIKFGHF